MPSKNYSISNSHNSLTLFKSRKNAKTLSAGFFNSTNKIVNMLNTVFIAYILSSIAETVSKKGVKRGNYKGKIFYSRLPSGEPSVNKQLKCFARYFYSMI